MLIIRLASSTGLFDVPMHQSLLPSVSPASGFRGLRSGLLLLASLLREPLHACTNQVSSLG